MSYDFGTKQQAAYEGKSSEGFMPGSPQTYTMIGEAPFLKGVLKFASDGTSVGQSANLKTVVVRDDTGAKVAEVTNSMNQDKRTQVEFPVVDKVSYTATVVADHQYSCAVLWSPQKETVTRTTTR